VTTNTELLKRAMDWIGQDPDQETRLEIAQLIEGVEKGDESSAAELAERFSGHLTFGTAGLRAAIAGGPMRMNRVVVSHAAYGLGQFLLSRVVGSSPRVVIGFDARKNSDVFARDTAEILAGMGITPLLFDAATPTPVVAFTLRHLNADAAVVVTASHNPPADNGYKVYLGGEDEGSQIVPPADSAIHEAILKSHENNRANSMARDAGAIEQIGDELVQAYKDHTLRLANQFDSAHRDALRICYTPMHGVGALVLEDLLASAGFTNLHVVQAQRDPDPLFSTVAFPNPEEPGALDLAQELARDIEADIIVANDPDADRLALCLPSRDGSVFQSLSGNEVGVILASAIARRSDHSGEGGVLGYSLVSSPITRVIAQHHGLTAVETPTGFKWISRLPGLIFGFEEALGYLVNPETVRDKDGLSAALFALCLAAELHARGKTLWDALDDVRSEYGGFASGQISLRFDTPEIAQDLMTRVRRDPAALFRALDLSSVVDYRTPPQGQPEADLIRYDTTTGDRIIIRPSGTEPKLKVYLDCLRKDQEDAVVALSELEKTTRVAIDSLMSSA